MVQCQNILLVEDDLDDQMLFIESIKAINNKIKYSVAYDGRDALDKLSLLKHLPDIIFVDINIPRMNGFEFLSFVKAHESWAKIPVVILSTSNNIADKAEKVGANGYVIKPPSLQMLIAEIEGVCHSIMSTIVQY